MNGKYQRVPTKFGPVTRFEVQSLPPAPFRALQESELEQLKERLLRVRLEETPADLNAALRRAANEAAALAWATPYPTLMFPELFAEKVEAARRQAKLQQNVRERSALLLAV